ncbi:MAG: hypothetical protein E6H07_19800 [Bacteroidetes bacterium]|nr:MAG: hypothetical protein E6H07_19800 [Bacteroidota bacterium]
MKKKSLLLVISLIVMHAVFYSCKKETSCENCKDSNKPPIAVAGIDQIVTLPTDSILLNGSASTDPDGTINEWLWKKISGPAAFNIINATSSSTVIKNLSKGIYQFELKVADNDGLFAKDTVMITVDSVLTNNHPPIADAGPDQTILLPINNVLLDGGNSFDPDNNISNYSWTKINGPLSFNIANSNATQTSVTNLIQGTYQFELKVTDNDGLSAKDTVMITVDSVLTSNHPPIADAGLDQAIRLPINNVLLDGGNSFDPDSNISNYSWTKINGPLSFNIVNSNATQTSVTNLIQGTYQFELKVTDAGGLFSKDTTTVVVTSSTNNLPPVAVPGNDSIIYSSLPACSAVPLTLILDGSSSYDPDGNIISYHWSGPGTISNPNSSSTTVTGLFQGTFNYSLIVTDNNGSNNTKYIVFTVLTGGRPVVNVTMTPLGNLSKPRMELATASVGNKIFFAGGYTREGPSAWAGESRVDIYDINSNSWSVAELSVARHGIAAVSAGNKVFFAGGHTSFYGDVDISEYATVDIYDAATNSWSVASLSEPRGYISATTIGNKVFFAGGYWIESFATFHYSNKVDIYDLSTNTWSTATLSEGRTSISAVAINNKVYFAGGETGLWTIGGHQLFDKIDVYDLTTNSWSVSTLDEPKVRMGGFAVNDKIYWAGGENSQGTVCKVEVRNANTQATSFDYLSHPTTAEYAVLKDNKILFTNLWQHFDLYNLNTNTWYTGLLPIKRSEAGLISVNNKIYLAGGWAHETQNSISGVWRIDF